MLNKKKYIFIGIIVLSLVLLCIGVTNLFLSMKSDENDSNNKIVLNMDDDFAKVVYLVAERNNDWSKLPLSKKFKKKYDSINGILLNDDFSNLGYSVEKEDTSKENQIVCLMVHHDFKEEYYYIHYTLNNKNELDDVEIVEKKLIYDEYGNEVDVDIEEYNPIALESDEFDDFVKRFCNEPNNAGDFSPRLWEWTLLSDFFIKKIKDSPFGVEYDDNPVLRTKVLDGTNYDDRIAYVEVDNGEIKEKFKIEFKITDDGVFDDFEVKKQ